MSEEIRNNQVMRVGTGAVLTDGSGQVAQFQRNDGSGGWQFVQGGLELGEEPIEGVLREIAEETAIGADALSFIAEHPDWLAYEYPPDVSDAKYWRGQVQRWFLFRISPDLPIDLPLDVEFRDYRWTDFATATETIVAFKRAVYQRIAEYFGPLTENGS